MTRALVVVAAVAVAFSRTMAQAPSSRIAPLRDSELTLEHRAVVASYVRDGALSNDVRTLLTHPASLPGVMPLRNYIAVESTLPPHDRAVLMLRTAWLTRSGYLWARYATVNQAAFAPIDFRRIESAAAVPAGSFDLLLLRAADGLHRQSFVDDDTWMALDARYSTEQLLDLIFTIGETTMMAGIVNSLGVPSDAGFASRAAEWALGGNVVRSHPTLNAPRILPLEQTFWTGELRALLDPDATGAPVAAVNRTMALHPALYRPQQVLSEYVGTRSTLTARARALVALRVAALCVSDYAWGAHVAAAEEAGMTSDEVRRIATTPVASAGVAVNGWRAADAAVLRAVDDLFARDAISDPVWATLSSALDRRQRIDLLISAGAHRMVAMALSTVGIPLEPGRPRLPRAAR